MTLSLFKEDVVYVFDTSALITLENTFKYGNPVYKAVWDEIETMVVNGNIVILDFVEEEVNSYEGDRDFLKGWIKKWKKKGKLVIPSDEAVINAAIPIINEGYNNGFIKKKKLLEGKDEADPYLVAYCKTNGCILVTEESELKPNRLPAVAKKNGVEPINLLAFFNVRGLRMIKRGKTGTKA